jgi:hypothetical protein
MSNAYDLGPQASPATAVKSEGAVHTPARLMVGLAAIIPTALTILISAAEPQMAGIMLLHLLPLVGMACMRDVAGFRTAAVVSSGIYIFAGLVMMILGVLLYLPTVLLLCAASYSTRESPRLRRNGPAVAGLFLTAWIVLVIVVAVR